MTCDDYFNELVRYFFKEANSEVTENRRLGEISEDEQHWALDKDSIKSRYHVDKQYMKSLTDKDRQEVELTLLEMMKEVASRDPAEGEA